MKKNALLVLLLLLLPAPQALGETHKFALVLGNNEGHDDTKRLRFAERDARKMFDVLTELGGFSASDVELLLGTDAARAMAAIDSLEGRIAARAKEPDDKTMLLFYYSGHAEGDVLELGEGSLKLERILNFLRSSSADVRLAFLDSCHSGKLISMKGGRRGPEFDIRVTDEITSKGYAIITSSADNELSQESAEIRGAFFTHYLVSALRGAGDKSGDGKVTLGEAYQHAYSRTLARTSVTIGGSQHPMYEFQLEGRGDIVLTNTSRGGSTLTVSSQHTGRLVVLDERENELVAEVEIEAGRPELLALYPGRYVAYLLSPGNGVRVSSAEIGDGARVSLDADNFVSVELASAVAKGGLFEGPRAAWSHRVGAGGLWRLWALEDATSSFGASAYYRLGSPEGWQPTLRLTWTARPDVGTTTGYNDFGALVGLGYVWNLGRIALRGELLAGYEHILMDDFDGQSRHSSGFGYLGIVGIEYLWGSFFIALDAGVGGRVFNVAKIRKTESDTNLTEKETVHRLDIQSILSLGWRWST